MTMEKQKENPKFSFLFGGDFYGYYKYKLALEQQQREWGPRLTRGRHRAAAGSASPPPPPRPLVPGPRWRSRFSPSRPCCDPPAPVCSLLPSSELQVVGRALPAALHAFPPTPPPCLRVLEVGRAAPQGDGAQHREGPSGIGWYSPAAAAAPGAALVLESFLSKRGRSC